MTLTIPRFAVRCEKAAGMQEVADRVSQALGCRLTPGHFREVPARTGTLIGMSVGLYEWGDAAGDAYRLDGAVDDYAYPDYLDRHPGEVRTIDISPMIRDALLVVTGFEWRLFDPDPGDLV